MRTAIGDLTPTVGVRAACEAFDFPRSSFYDPMCPESVARLPGGPVKLHSCASHAPVEPGRNRVFFGLFFFVFIRHRPSSSHVTVPHKVQSWVMTIPLETDFARAQHGGLTATVNLHDVGGEDVTAPVDFISNAVSNSAGTIELRATFANKDAALVPGQLVDVTVALANIKNAIVVPRVAVNLGL